MRFDQVMYNYWDPFSLQLLVYQHRAASLFWKGFVDFPVDSYLRSISSHLPHSVLLNFRVNQWQLKAAGVPAFYFFYFAKRDLGLMIRSWLNLVINITPHYPGLVHKLPWAYHRQLAPAELYDKETFRSLNYSVCRYFILYFLCEESKAVLNKTPWGSLLFSKSRLWCEESLFKYSCSIFIHCLIIQSKWWGMWQCNIQN